MAQHFLLSAAARPLSPAKVYYVVSPIRKNGDFAHEFRLT